MWILESIFGVLTLSFGVYALSKDRLQLSKKYVLEGNSARIAGILLVIAPIIGVILTLNGQVDSGIFNCSCWSIIGVLAFAAFQAWKSKKPPVKQMTSLKSEPDQDAIDFLNAHNIQSAQVEHKHAGTSRSSEAKAILAAVGTLIASLVTTGIILAMVDTLIGRRVADSLIVLLAVIDLGITYWVYGLVRRRSAKMPTQLMNTTFGISEKGVKGSKHVESPDGEPEPTGNTSTQKAMPKIQRVLQRPPIQDERVDVNFPAKAEQRPQKGTIASKNYSSKTKSPFRICPKCGMKVLPKSDGTCPSCQSKIM